MSKSPSPRPLETFGDAIAQPPAIPAKDYLPAEPPASDNPPANKPPTKE